MEQILTVIQMVVSIVLIVLILMQARGTGFGRSGASSAASFTRRGLEKLIFRATFVVVTLFLVLSILQLLY